MMFRSSLPVFAISTDVQSTESLASGVEAVPVADARELQASDGQCANSTVCVAGDGRFRTSRSCLAESRGRRAE